MVGLSIPTDNIYKFCAIFGLVLILGPQAGLLYFYNYITELIDTASLESAKVGIEMEFSDHHEIGGLKQLRQKILNAQLDQLLKPEDLPSVLSPENLDKSIEERTEKLKAISIAIAKNEATIEKARRYSQDWKKMFYVACSLLLEAN